MKYRVLTPEEMEAYKIGYKVGARELFITGQEWDSEEEHRIYRKGYNAGCKDRERKNLKPELLDKCQQCQQCQQCLTCDSQDSQDCVYPIDTVIDDNNNTRNSNKGGMGGKEKGGFVPPTLEEVLEYAREQNNFAGCGGFACTPEQAEEFWSYYESQGWRIGNDSNTPIRDWKPKLRQWCIKAKQTPMNQFGQRVVKMTAKEIKEAENHMKLQKMLNGEL